MSTVKEKIGQALASMEQVRKDLQAIEATQAELEAVSRDRDAAKTELAETEARLASSKAELVKHDEEFTQWRDVCAKERAKGNTAIDIAQAQLRVFEGQVKERQAEHDTLVESMAALGRRLRVA